MAHHCPAKCGKKFISAEHARNHADTAHPKWDDVTQIKRKGWATPYGFVDFQYPITHQEACDFMKKQSEKLWKTQTNNGKE